MVRIALVLHDSLAGMSEFGQVRQRDDFLEGAVRARLAQLKQIRAVKDAAGTWSQEDREEPSWSIRRTRQAWDIRQAWRKPGMADLDDR